MIYKSYTNEEEIIFLNSYTIYAEGFLMKYNIINVFLLKHSGFFMPLEFIGKYIPYLNEIFRFLNIRK